MTQFSNTYSGTQIITKSNIQNVFYKIEDDFWAIRTRGFKNIDFDWLKKVFEDIEHVALQEELSIAELQFKINGDQWIVRYELDDMGNIHQDNDSGGIRYSSIPSDAQLNVTIKRKNKTEATDNYLRNRGWGNNGVLQGDDGLNDRSYSDGGVGVTRKLKGKW